MSTNPISATARNKSKSALAMKDAIASMREHPETLPDYYARRIAMSRTEQPYSYTLLVEARRLIRLRPDLIESVLSGLLSVDRGLEIATKGHRIRCPACDGRGFMFHHAQT